MGMPAYGDLGNALLLEALPQVAEVSVEVKDEEIVDAVVVEVKADVVEDKE